MHKHTSAFSLSLVYCIDNNCLFIVSSTVGVQKKNEAIYAFGYYKMKTTGSEDMPMLGASCRQASWDGLIYPGRKVAKFLK